MDLNPINNNNQQNPRAPFPSGAMLRAAKQTAGPASSKRTGFWSVDPAPTPALVISPLAWLKLMLFLHAGETEVGGFAVSRADDELLYVDDFVAVRQRVTAVTVSFDDAAVADYFDDRVDAGLPPARFARVWVHTHPGDSPEPSHTDEQTFARVFGPCDWAVMLIVSRTGRTYCRLSFNAGPGGSLLLPVRVDWASWPEVLLEQSEQLGTLFENWMDEYAGNVEHLPIAVPGPRPRSGRPAWSEDHWTEDRVYGPLDLQDDETYFPHEQHGSHERLVDLFELAAGEVMP